MEGTSATINMISGVQGATATDPKTVEVGTIVKAIYVEVWGQASSAQPGTVTILVERLPGGASNPTATDVATLHTYANKKNILYMTQGITGDSNTNPTPWIRQWILIPKGKQRFGLDDRMQLTIRAISTDFEWCGMNLYLAKS